MRIFSKLFPAALWNRRFTVAWAGSFFTIIAFDLLWSMATSFRALSFMQTYLFAFALALIMALPALVQRRRWLMGIVLVIADLLCIANLMYGRTYYTPIPPASYMLAGNVAQYTDAILHSLKWVDLIFPVITILTLLGMHRPITSDRRPRTLKQLRENQTASPGKVYLITLLAAVLLCIISSLFKGGVFHHIEKLKSECYYRATPPVAYTLPVSILADLMESTRPVNDAEKADARSWLAEHYNLQKSFAEIDTAAVDTTAMAVVSPKRNLVLIIVESLEGWPLGRKVEGKEITPNLNRLTSDTARTWMCRRVLSQVGPGRSVDGQLLMTAGMYPMNDYVYSMRFADRSYPHLSQVLRNDRGAKSYLLGGDRATTWNQGAVALQFGFDEVKFRENWDSSESFGHPRNPSDGSLLRQIEDKMKAGKIWPVGETAMVEIITYSSHFPFTIPDEHKKIKLSGKYPEHLAEYITAINYTDWAIGQFVDYVLSRDDADDTMIAIVGDHEAIGGWRVGMRSYSKEMADLIDPLQFVPLIVINSPVSGNREAVMGQVDVYPTLLDMLGATPAPEDLLSTSTFPGMGFSALRNGSPSAAIELGGWICGDTTALSPDMIRHLRAAAPVSSTLIRASLLHP